MFPSTQTNLSLLASDIPKLLHNLVQQEGDCGAELLSIIEHYIRQCCRTYYSITREEQQDITQEASIKLLLHYDDLKHSISKRWLYVMVKNLCLDVLRTQRNNSNNQLEHFSSEEEPNEHRQLTLEDFEPYSYIDSYTCLDNVFAYIEAQPTGEEDIAVYSHFACGSSRADIAHITGRTVSAVTKRISILRSRLKALRDELC